MSAPAAPLGTRAAETPASVVTVGIAMFAAVELALAVFMAVAPHAFYRAIGPFGSFNGHYIRDVASFEAALGVGLLLALRAPVLARAGARRHDRPVRACTASTTCSTSAARTRAGPATSTSPRSPPPRSCWPGCCAAAASPRRSASRPLTEETPDDPHRSSIRETGSRWADCSSGVRAARSSAGDRRRPTDACSSRSRPTRTRRGLLTGYGVLEQAAARAHASITALQGRSRC